MEFPDRVAAQVMNLAYRTVVGSKARARNTCAEFCGDLRPEN